jgi:hypothetical protein
MLPRERGFPSGFPCDNDFLEIDHARVTSVLTWKAEATAAVNLNRAMQVGSQRSSANASERGTGDRSRLRPAVNLEVLL